MDQKIPVLMTKMLRHSYEAGVEFNFPDLTCDRGGQLLITGKSGVGKTTLLHLLGGLLGVQKGEIRIDGQDISKLSSKALDRFRGEHIGLIFQQPRFIRSLNALENLEAAQFFGRGKTDRSHALALLEELKIADKAQKVTAQLSGGERQRLAIAAALSTRPDLVLADEPTSSLDDENAERVLRLLMEETSKNHAALVIVTHDGRLKPSFKNHVKL
jgi:putative ABC transport system ATP-binding protein